MKNIFSTITGEKKPSLKNQKSVLFFLLGRSVASTLRSFGLSQTRKIFSVGIRDEVLVDLDDLGALADFDLLEGSGADGGGARAGGDDGGLVHLVVGDGGDDGAEEDDGENALGVGAEGLGDGEGGVVGRDGEGLVLLAGGLDEDADDEREVHGLGVEVGGEGVLDGGLRAGGDDALVGVAGEVLVEAGELVEGRDVGGDEHGGVFGVAGDVVDDDEGFDLLTGGDLAILVLGEDSEGGKSEAERLFFGFAGSGAGTGTSGNIDVVVIVGLFGTDGEDSDRDHGKKPHS